MSTHLYSIAVQSIQTHVDAEQARLDSVAAAARAANIAAVRVAAMDGVDQSSPLYPVASLLSQTITVGRDSDCYPQVSWPDTTRNVLKAALSAGIIPRVGADGTIATWPQIGTLRMQDDFSGLSREIKAWHEDYAAWSSAREYRHKQSVTSL